ncbi:hypothetical protein [Streptomyces sp. NRRL F-5135]|uniref:hypothetical protein n=1 Tax=Streptomyces sp. NRRL F-5135 TaxID=1463858 RepID=UPI0004CA4924|nr:hypothetical protein [Streptomyces sp. NRRL F-5135]
MTDTPDPTDPAYIEQLAATLNLAAEFRIPCPGHPHGHAADLRVQRRLDGNADGWAVFNDNPGNEHAWTGTEWTYRGELARAQIYRYDRQTALNEAVRIAPLETAAHIAHIARLRSELEESS